MPRRPNERDLRHGANSFRFGDAMVACEGFAPDCSANGRCQMERACFSSAPALVAARMIEGLLPTDGRAGVHFAYLKRCAEMLRSGRLCL